MPERRGARTYLLIVTVLGFAVLAALVYRDHAALTDTQFGQRIGDVELLVFFVIFTLVASVAPVTTTSGIVLSVSLATLFAATLILPPGLAAITACIGTIDTRRPGRDIPWNRFLFNRAMFAMIYGLAGLTYHLILSTGSEHGTGAAHAFSVVTAGLIALIVIAVLNSPLTIVAISLLTGESIRKVAYRTLAGVVLSYAGLAPVGALIAYQVAPRSFEGVLVASLIGILLLVYRELSRRSLKLETVARGSYIAQSRLIDKKDRSTYGHSERVGLLAEAVASKMGLHPELVEQIRIGATLHDLGKIAIPDAILHKPGKLDDAEWEVMKTHAAEGWEVLNEQEVLLGAAAILLTHHENFDGTGYPQGLAGRAIPVGGRIARIADSYDCITNVRDYRVWVREPFEALSELTAQAGTLYDPGVIEAFTEVLLERHPELVAQVKGPEHAIPGTLTAALRQRSYLRLWLAHGFSNFGDMLTTTGLALAAYSLTQQVWTVGAVFAVRALPNLLFGLVAGHIVDRYDRKSLMLFTDILRVVLVGSIPLLLHTNFVILMVIAFLASTAAVVFNPARSAALPDIVPGHMLQAANSGMELIQRVTEIAGYAAAGAIILLGGVPFLFAVDAVTFLVSAGLIVGITFPELIRESRKSSALGQVRRDVGEGLRHISSVAGLRTMFLLSFFMAAAASAILPLTVPLAVVHLHTGPTGFPLLEGALAAGATAGAALTGYFTTSRRSVVIVMGAAGMGVTVVFAGISASLPVTMILFVLAGLANMLYLIPLITAIQEITEGDIRGRVFAARFTVVQVGVLFGMGYASLSTTFVPPDMVGVAFAGSGVLMLVVSGIAALSPSLRRV